MDSPLILKPKQFALDIFKVCNFVKREKKESILTNQLIRSGTSIGANVREECSESEYWLELLIESGYYEDRMILAKCTEVKKILIASINTAKKNQNI